MKLILGRDEFVRSERTVTGHKVWLKDGSSITLPDGYRLQEKYVKEARPTGGYWKGSELAKRFQDHHHIPPEAVRTVEKRGEPEFGFQQYLYVWYEITDLASHPEETEGDAAGEAAVRAAGLGAMGGADDEPEVLPASLAQLLEEFNRKE